MWLPLEKHTIHAETICGATGMIISSDVYNDIFKSIAFTKEGVSEDIGNPVIVLNRVVECAAPTSPSIGWVSAMKLVERPYPSISPFDARED
jgi:hypothetical protein